MADRQARIDEYYQGEHAAQLAEWLVDLEDQVAVLQERDRELTALEAAGVDNWEGYGNAIRSVVEDEDEW